MCVCVCVSVCVRVSVFECALRIHDAKVRRANGFDGAPAASALLGNREG